jgi:hypothetical protein
VNGLDVLRHPDAVRFDAGAATFTDYDWNGTDAPPPALWTVTVALAKAFGISEIPARGSGELAAALVKSVHYALMVCGVTDPELLALLQQHAADPDAVAVAYYQAAQAKCAASLTGPAPSAGYPWGWILGGAGLAGAAVAAAVVLSRRKKRRQ